MKRILTISFAISALLILSRVPASSSVHVPAAASAPAANAVRISQVYGGGGNTGAPYQNDFVELFNSGLTTVDLTGWSVQYASASGTSWQVTNLSGTVAVGGYYLVQEAAGNSCSGSPCGISLPTPDATGSIPMSRSDGKVALVNNTTPSSGSCPTSGIVDLVGYGGANCFEGPGTAPQLSNTTAALRGGDGCTDTDNNVADFTAGTPNPRNSGSPTNNCGGGETAPFVSGTNPANNATGVGTTSDVTITFSEPVDVAGNWYQLHCNVSGDHTAAVTGGPTAFTLNPDSDFVQGDTCTVTVYASQVTDQDSIDPPDHMAADYSFKFFVTGACTTIPYIQGADNASPCGTVTNIQGCITGVAASGFYMQAVGSDVDGNLATSDGIYVYRGSSWTNPSGWVPGNLISVSGQIIEYYNATEFQAGNAVNVLDGGTNCGGNGYPAATTVGPNTDPNADPMSLYERYEGMRVQMTFDGWVIGPTQRYTSRFAFGDPEIAFVDFGSSIPDYSRVFERDYAGYQGISYISGGLNFDLPNLDFGDEISGTNVTGVLGYQFDKYTLLVDAAPTLATVDHPDVQSNEIAANPADGEFDICFANVENLFDNHDDGMGDWGDWAPGWPTPDTPEGYAVYQAKLSKVAGVFVDRAKSCMVIGLEEMEGKQQVYDDLAAAMHISDTAHTWTAAYVSSGDSRNITQGFLWRNEVTLVGSVVPVTGTLYASWVSDGVLDFVRTPPAGLFRFNAGTPNRVDVHLYTVHFKSKSSSGSCSTPDCTDRREKEVADLRDILLHHQNAGEYAIGGGDYNDTFGSSPIAILDAVSPTLKSLYYDLGERERYSYIFNGESEVLDHLYATGNLLLATPGWWHTFAPVHVNADFPEIEHASDHDPIRVRFVPYTATITRGQGTEATLAWSPVLNATAYQVWRDTSPYFTPAGTSAATVTAPPWTDPNATGDPTTNYYYVVTAVNAYSVTLGTSSRVGEFDLALMPGQ